MVPTNLFTISNLMFALGLIGTIFTVYLYFRNPQVESEKTDLILNQKLSDIEKQFALFNSTFQAHITADNLQFSTVNSHIVEVDKSVVKLTTIIDERIPKK